MATRKRITGQKPGECPACEGWGYPPATAPEIEVSFDGKLKTVSLGSGCWRCHGTGQLGSKV